MARSSRKLPVLRMTSAEIAERSASRQSAQPAAIVRLPTYGYLCDMIALGAREAKVDFYDPIVELVKLSKSSGDERIQFACHAHLSDKLYPKARDWQEGENPDDAERIARRNAMLDQLVAAFSRRVLEPAK
jgi:hypothetical protein